jgi:CHAD domain-containing protein
VKPQRVDLRGVAGEHEVVERVVKTRLREVRALANGLERRDRQGLHDFRIACKRLRYALERFDALKPSFQEAAEMLASLQDALGEARDRDVLLAILPPAMGATQRRLQREREAHVDQAVDQWEALSSYLNDSLIE